MDERIGRYKSDVEEFYRRFVAGGFGPARLTFYADEELEDLPAELRNSSLACGNPLKYLREDPPPPGGAVLDLGCGAGFELVRLARELTPRLAVGLDYSAEMIRRCEQNIRDYGPDRGIACLRGDAERLPFADASFDAVISNAALNLVPDKTAAFREIRRVLRPDGRLFFSDVTVLRALPEAAKSRFGVMDGLYFAPTLLNWQEELQLARRIFQRVSLRASADILPDPSHNRTLLDGLGHLDKKNRRFLQRALDRAAWRMIEVEARLQEEGQTDPIRCHCGQTNLTRTHQVIDAEEAPLLLRSLLRGELNRYHCTGCGRTQDLPVPVMILSHGGRKRLNLFPAALAGRDGPLRAQLPPGEDLVFDRNELETRRPDLARLAAIEPL